MPIQKPTSFLDTFFKGRQPEEYIALRAIKGKTDLGGSWYYQSLGEVTTKAHKIKKESNVYFGVCTRRKPSPNKVDTWKGYAVWADLDLGSQYLAEKKKLLASIPLLFEPSIVVDSGNGLHLYWLLDEPTLNMDQLERTCRNIGIQIGGDDVFDRSRIMRLPNTLNLKQGPPGLMVQIVSENDRRYALEDLDAVACIEEKIVSRIISGSTRGFKSRSHRDWSVVTSLVRCGATDELIEQLFSRHAIGDKSEENSTYLTHTIKRARQKYESEGAGGEAQGGKGTVFEQNNAWFVERGGKKKQVSTYVFYPDSLIAGDAAEQYYEGSVFTEFGTEHKHIRFRHSDFQSIASMASRLPFMDCSFLGSDLDVRLVLQYLFSRFQESGGLAKELRRQTGFYRGHWLGTSQVLGPHGLISEEDQLIVYDRRLEEGGALRHEYRFKEPDNKEFQRFFDILPRVNKLPVTSTAFGWLGASIFKSRLEELGYRFPFLNISGTRGAGKTTLIKEIMQPLVGYQESRTYDSSTTKFVLLSLLGSSTDIFISLSEFRQSSMSETRRNDLLRYLLLLYDSGYDPRGQANQTIKNYRLTTPVTLDGEDMIGDAALLERSLHCRMSPEDILGDASDIFLELQDMDLNHIGSQMILFSLQYDYRSTLEWAANEAQGVYDSLNVLVPSRPGRNASLILFGIRFLEDFAHYLECQPSNFGDYREIILEALSIVIDIRSGRTRRAVDDFVEDIVSEASRMLVDFGNSSFAFRYFREDQTLRFHMSTAYSWWRKHRRQQGLPALEKQSIESQLDETAAASTGAFVLSGSRIMIEGSPMTCYGVNLSEASKVLDVPSDMIAHGLSVLASKDDVQD